MFVNPKHVEHVMTRFAKNVIAKSRSNLTRQKKNVSRKLYKSIDAQTSVSKNGSLSQSFFMEEYGAYQDLGVRGTKGTKNNFKRPSPFRYRSKRPPISALNKWMVKKGIAPRNESGQFTTRRGLMFSISKSIFEYGIPQTLFFTKPFEAAFKNLPQEIIEAYGLDLEEYMNFVIERNVSNN